MTCPCPHRVSSLREETEALPSSISLLINLETILRKSPFASFSCCRCLESPGIVPMSTLGLQPHPLLFSQPIYSPHRASPSVYDKLSMPHQSAPRCSPTHPLMVPGSGFKGSRCQQVPPLLKPFLSPLQKRSVTSSGSLQGDNVPTPHPFCS